MRRLVAALVAGLIAGAVAPFPLPVAGAAAVPTDLANPPRVCSGDTVTSPSGANSGDWVRKASLFVPPGATATATLSGSKSGHVWAGVGFEGGLGGGGFGEFPPGEPLFRQAVWTNTGSSGVMAYVTAEAKELFGGHIDYWTLELQLSGGAPDPWCEPDSLDTDNASFPNGCATCAGDPVNVVQGNYWQSWTDLSILGRGPGLQLARTYSSSRSAASGPLGSGWSLSYGMSLSESAGKVTIRQENGAAVRFSALGTGWAAPQYVAATLVHEPDGSWTFRRMGTEVFRFDVSGRLSSIGDLSGNVTSLSYVDGFLSSVTDPSGRELVITWSGGHIVGVAAPATTLSVGGMSVPMIVSYGYTGDDLTSVTRPDGAVWTFGYDAQHRLTTIRAPRHDALGASAPVVENHYDAQGRVDWQEDRLDRRTTFLYQPGVTTVTDPQGNSVAYEHNGSVSTGMIKNPGPGQSRWVYGVDPYTLGRSTVTDPNGNVTTQTFNDVGLVTSRTTPQGTTTIAYDPVTLVPTSVTDPMGVTTTYTYLPGTDRLTTTSRPVNPGGGTWSTSTTYDDPANPGRPTSVVDPMGKSWSYAYSGQGDLVSVTDPTGRVTTRTYNSLGWPLTVVSPAGNAPGGDPAQHTTSFEYDGAGRVLGERDPLWSAGSPAAHQVARTYDANGNVESVTDGNGQTTTFEYDAADQQVAVHRPDGSTLSTRYRADGRIDAQIDGAGHETTYSYDAQGRLADSSDPLGNTERFGYDAAGNLVAKQDPGGDCAAVPKVGCTTMAYDAANQLTGIDYSDPATPDVTGVTYDANGRRTSMTDGTGTSSWTWDSLGRLLSSATPAGGAVGYGYDLRGDLTSIAYPGGVGTVTRGFDDAGRLRSVTDWLGRTSTFDVDADANPQSDAYGNGTTADWSVDVAGQLMGITHHRGANPVASFTYERDGNGQETRVSSTGVPADNHTYGYNPLEFLTTVDDKNPATTHRYDAADNLVRLPDFTVQRFDVASQLTELSRVSLVGVAAANVAATQRSVTAWLPGGVRPGDVVLVASVEAAGAAPPSIPGYTLFRSVRGANGATTPRIDVYWRVAQTGDASITATYADSNVTSAKALQVAVYRGVDTTNPVVATDGTTINGTQVPIVGFPAATGGDHVVAFEAGYANTAAASWTADAPYTQRYPQTDGVALITTGVADQPVTADGAVPNGVAHLSRSTQLAELSVLLRPAVTTYGYDTRGNRTGVAPPGGAATTLGYDQANRLTSVTTGTTSVASYGYRGDGMRLSKTVGAATTSFAWDESGSLPLLLVETTGGFQTNYVYGPGGRVIEEIQARPAITKVGSGHIANLGTTSNDVIATFPAAQPGDQILVAATTRNTAGINTPAGYTWVNGAQVSGARTHLYRRTATGGESSVTVTFPTSAGVARIVQVVVYRNVDPANPIEGTTLGTAEGISTGGETVYVPSITTTDTGDQLVFVGGSVGANATAGTWTPPAGMTTQLSDTLAPDYGQIVADTALAGPGPTGTLRASYSAPNTNLIGIAVALRPAPTPVLFHHVDQLGSTRALTDNNGAVVATYTYDPYGRLAASTAPTGRTITNPFGFAGEYTDAETGFQYLRARYYDPATGQFLTRDPLEAITRSPYAYVDNDPLNATDPLGLGTYRPYATNLGRRVRMLVTV